MPGQDTPLSQTKEVAQEQIRAWLGSYFTKDEAQGREPFFSSHSYGRRKPDLVSEQGDKILSVIVDTIKRWSGKEIAERLELQVGKELQYIRINGTVVGGLLGLCIFLAGSMIPRLF